MDRAPAFRSGWTCRGAERVVRAPPVKATAPGVKGHAEIGCVVTDKGLDRCFVLYFQSFNTTSSVSTADAALAAVDQAAGAALAKDTWVIIPMDFTPSAPPRP